MSEHRATYLFELALVASREMHKTAYFIGPKGLALNPTPQEIERLAKELRPVVAAVLQRAKELQ